MSIILPGYHTFELIHEGEKNAIYRAISDRDRTSVIVKILKIEYPTLAEIARLRHEYNILQRLDLTGVVKAYSVENYRNGIALILEDFGGESLKKLMESQSLPVLSFLSIAIQIADSLVELDKNHIIHKDIKPENILINRNTFEVKITDFSIATRLSRETPFLTNSDAIEGTLAYMSPEQSGRMNRSLDYRTDFYSLGVTFYELLTGQLPFTSTDPIELVHCHIAKIPVLPHKINAEIPEAISAIVIKLMAKNAEDRYQSASGLKADLESCFTQLIDEGEIENFTPGILDKSGQFIISQKLYGRESEVQTLLAAFDRVSKGATELMLVSGYSGIGKTSVVNEIHKPIVKNKGYFIAGKFDQFKRNSPYAALIEAFQNLIRQILTESSHKIEIWKQKLLETLGQNGQVIIDVIPEVEVIIGTQSSVPKLGPNEAQNRFNRVFQKFISVFTQPEHPLVLFLDDLQWADSASLKSIELLMTHPDCKYLLAIAAYRDNEVSPTHPFIQTVEKIQKRGAVINRIEIEPLNLEQVRELIADSLGETKTNLNHYFTLAELVFNKTQGNPLFLTQLLQTLYDENLLNFDFTEGRWLWNIDRILEIGITDYNVVELVARNIQKLSPPTQNLLQLASCIGNRFNLDVLAIVSEQSILTTANQLWEALQMGLILPLSNAYKIPLAFESDKNREAMLFDESRVAYKFLHDRVQQGAYSLIPESERKANHLKIGQLLLQKTAKYTLEANIFDIVNQLNMGIEAIGDRPEKEKLANLNLTAARKAKAATAYEAAVRYSNVGLELLTEKSWIQSYELTFNLHVEAIESEYLTANFTRSQQLTEVALEHTTKLLDRVKVSELKMQIFIAQLEIIKAIEIGLELLKNLGVSLEEIPKENSLVVELPPLNQLDKIPVLTDAYQLSALRILTTLCAPVFFAKPQMLPQLMLTMVNLCIEQGHSPLAAFAYAFYGLFLSGLGKLDTGYHSGQIALKLLEQFDAKQLTAKVYNLFNAHNRPWKEHAKNSLDPFLEGVQAGLETGDVEWACYCAGNYCGYSFLTEDSLNFIVEQQAKYIALVKKGQIKTAIYYGSTWRQLALNLRGEAADSTRLIGESFNESQMLPRLKKSKSGTVLFMVYLAKTILLYQFKEYSEAVNMAYLASEQVGSALGYLQVAVLNFYDSLARLAMALPANANDREEYLKQVDTNQEKMKIWAVHAPMNFQHKYDLVEAERARVQGQTMQASELYDRAIAGAKEFRYLQDEAIANELAAEFYFSIGKNIIAQAYLTEAYYTYIRWGANAKVKHLESQYSDFFSQIFVRSTREINVMRTSTSTTGTDSTALDLDSVRKASQSISSELVLDKFLENLMHILIENAGARKGLLFMEKAGALVLVAGKALERDNIRVLPCVAITARPDLPVSIIHYVQRTREIVVLNNASTEGYFTQDSYILKNLPKSILCMPLIHQGNMRGLLYLENNLVVGAFTSQRTEVLNILCSQASISLEKAELYQELHNYSQQLQSKNGELHEWSVRDREKAKQLEQVLHKLEQVQTQLVQTENISNLGQPVASAADKVNHPINAIAGNLNYACEYVEGLIKSLNLYYQYFLDPPVEMQDKAEERELNYLTEDLLKLLFSMRIGIDRIYEIVQSLRNCSSIDTPDKKLTDIHAGIDSTVMILHHRLQAYGKRKAIKVVKEYGDLPSVICYPGQLNQAFMNLLVNAIDALEQKSEATRGDAPESSELLDNSSESPILASGFSPTIYIRTALVNENTVEIRIKDNGPGMSEESQQKLFEPCFTTKPEGQGTGWGLAIAHQIVVEEHGGHLQCLSVPGQGTEFVISIPVQCQQQTFRVHA